MITHIVMKAIMITLLLNPVVQSLSTCKYEFVNIDHVFSEMSTSNLDALVNYKSKVITQYYL